MMNDSASSTDDYLNALASRFLVFDGPDGSGKSSQYTRFRQFITQHHPHLEICEIREPGGTAIGEQIRDVLLDPENRAAHRMDIHTEMLLFMASRAQVVRERIIPALDRGALVIADRFLSSTLAYQGAAGGLEESDILAVGKVACGKTWPADLILIFDVDEKTAASRLNPLLDRMEAKGADFHRRVRHGFLDQARKNPAHYAVIDASQPFDDVFQSVMNAVRNLLK